MHPNEIQLSLYAGGELSLLEKVRTGLHIRGCETCKAAIEGAERGRAELRRAADELPAGLNWERLSSEMTGNIRVGLAAGECVGPVMGKSERLGWRAAAVLASGTALIMTAWWLNIPQSKHLAVSGNAVRLEATAAGIEMKQNGGALVLLNQNGGSGSTIFVSTPGSLRARYVNAETGQVTINNVYAQ
ncbi:MAG: hypothetical protein ABJF23_24890 [Bryobacteraceae bacterium]